ncbi:hypothetical protein ACFQ2Y_09860 [Streptomyces malaysiensis subsp. malaysiensis]
MPIRPDRADAGDRPLRAVAGTPARPLVIEDMDATTLVPPAATAHRDRFNNIVISWTTTAPETTS